MIDRMEAIAVGIVVFCVLFVVITGAIDRYQRRNTRQPSCIHVWRRRSRVRLTDIVTTQRRYCARCQGRWWPHVRPGSLRRIARRARRLPSLRSTNGVRARRRRQ